MPLLMLLLVFSTVKAHLPRSDLYIDAALTAENAGHVRASAWSGIRLGGLDGMQLGLFVLPLNVGYSSAEGKTYVPVQSGFTALAWGLYQLAEHTQSEGWKQAIAIPMVPAVAAIPLSGTRLSLGYPYANAFLGHRMEIYAPHPGLSANLEAGFDLAIFEVSLFKRLSTVEAFSDAGLRLGLFWPFPIE